MTFTIRKLPKAHGPDVAVAGLFALTHQTPRRRLRVASAAVVGHSAPGCIPREVPPMSLGFTTMTTATLDLTNDLKAAIRNIPDYPKPGIMFRDITTLLGNARAFRRAVDELVQPWAGSKIDKVAGIEARGFILGGAVAHQVSAGFVPIRKKGKLPH